MLSCLPACYCSQRTEGKKSFTLPAALPVQRLHWQLSVTTENAVRLQAAPRIGLKWGFVVFFHVFCSATSETFTQLCSDHPTQGFLIYDTQTLAMIHHRTPQQRSARISWL